MSVDKLYVELEMCNVFLISIPSLEHNNKEMIESSRELVQFITKRYSDTKIKQTAKAYFSNINNQNSNLVNSAYNWLKEFSRCFAGELNKIESSVIPDDFACDYFYYIINNPRIDKDLVNHYYTFSQQFNKRLPEYAFNALMHLITLYPSMLNNKERPYIYSTEDEQEEFLCCPVCGNTGEPYFASNSFQMVNFKNPHLPFKLWMCCETCASMYTRFFSKVFLAQSLQQKLIVPKYDEKNTEKASAFVFATWCEIINKIQKLRKIDRVLEVGVGTGAFIATALEMNIPVDAVEIDETSAQKISDLLNIEINCMDFLCYDSDKKYSAIFMGDVIEHITDPKKALKKAYDLLDDNGILWISTPNFNSAFSRFLKFKDPMWMEPTHITYFSFDSFDKILDECGFKLLEYNVSSRYNGSMELIMIKK